MYSQETNYEVTLMVQLLGVPRQGYFAWLEEVDQPVRENSTPPTMSTGPAGS